MLLKDKRIAIFNVANKRSIAWSIAQAMDSQGAELILGYQNERMRDNVEKLLGELSLEPLALIECDVACDQQIDSAAEKVKQVGGSLDGLVHCLAYAPRQALEAPYVETTRQDFHTALDVSTYSLVSLTNRLRPYLNKGASIITLSYLGAERVIPNYNVMGVAKAALEASVRYLAYELGPEQIRVNAISAGPINTLAARGVAHFVEMLDLHSDRAAMKRNIDGLEVGDTAVFLTSRLSSGITGETLHVDAGYHMMGM